MNAQGKIWRWWSAPPSREVMADREALLKYELSLIQKAAYEEAQPIIKEIMEIEAMKPPKPMFIADLGLAPEAENEMRAKMGWPGFGKEK